MLLIGLAVAQPLHLNADRGDLWADRSAWMVEVLPGTTLVGATPRFPAHPELARFVRTGALPSAWNVVRVWRGDLPVPPPGPSATPDFRGEQFWLDPEIGLGAAEALRFPGGAAAGLIVADIEYGWDPDHEDLAAAPLTSAFGWDSDYYAYHGTSVIGQLRASINGFGVDGALEQAEILVISPFPDPDTYDVAAAILGATELLGPGDVLLIEQQAYLNGDYCPVEADPAAFAAIEAATAAGIVVIEPGGNGGQNLDDAGWEGWFDREVQDSGAVIVGGGRSPLASGEARTWWLSGSSYGSRVDVQGWFDSIATTANGDLGASFADLYYPDEDPLRAYTSGFGGTSGAAPMVAAAAVVLQGVRIAQTGAPMHPLDVRAALVSTGLPQPADDEARIGPMPTLRPLLRTYGRP